MRQFIPTIRKQQFPAFKNQMLENIEEKLVHIYEKIHKYDKKNNIENLNKLKNDLYEFWCGKQGVKAEYFDFRFKDPDNIYYELISFFEKIQDSNINNFINDFLFYINWSNGEYISESISMEFLIRLIEIKNKFSYITHYINIIDIDFEKDLHQQKNTVKEAIINALNLTGLKTWAYKRGVAKEEDIVSCDRMFLNLFSLFYKDKELDERLKKYILKEPMANFEDDVRDGNIGAFSQGVVVGERNASKLALEVLDEIAKRNFIFIDRKGNEEYLERIRKDLENIENLKKSQIIDLGQSIDKPKPLSWEPVTTKSMG